jgi:hypothetical protein
MPLNTPLFLVIKENNSIVTKKFSADTNNEDLRYVKKRKRLIFFNFLGDKLEIKKGNV